MKSQDRKMRKTDVLNTKGILRLIESIPSPKAEPFKLWLASLGSEKIDEVFNPEIAINRAVDYYCKRGYDDKWIKARLIGTVDRFKLTDVWKESNTTHYMNRRGHFDIELHSLEVNVYIDYKDAVENSIIYNLS